MRLAAAVHETLSPFMTEMKEDLAAVKEKQDDLSETVKAIDSELQKTSDLLRMSIEPTVCGGTGGWRRVVYLNMTDPNTNCPSGWQLTTHSKRTCGRVSNYELSCDSVFFPVSEGNYTKVCGSIRAYQYGGTDGFEAYDDRYVTTIDGAYVAGVSLTHGSPRQHIWTFAAGYSQGRLNWDDACPCDATINITTPSFISEDYFCESGDNSGIPLGFHADDPLWDGEGCSNSSSSCSFNNPPYFTKQLPSPTSDPIEARICMMDENEDSAIELIELYVK